MKNVKKWLPGAIISIAILAAILYFVDFQTMWNSIRAADYRLLLVSASLSFVWMAVRAKLWQTLLRDKPTYKDVLYTAGEGYLLNNFLPFRLGEFGRAFLLSRKSGGMTFGEILPTIVIERAVDLAFSAAIFLFSLPFVVGTQGSKKIGYVVGVIVLMGLVFMYILARNNQWALDLFHKFSARWPAIQKLGGRFLESFFQGLTVLTDGWLFLRFMFWMTLDWIIALAAYYLIMRAFFPQTQLIWALFGLGAAAFGGAVPSLPGAVGTFEGAVAGALTLVTGDQSTSLAVALTARLYNYLNSGVIGTIGLLSEGQTLSSVYRELLNFRNKDEAEETKVNDSAV